MISLAVFCDKPESECVAKKIKMYVQYCHEKQADIAIQRLGNRQPDKSDISENHKAVINAPGLGRRP